MMLALKISIAASLFATNLYACDGRNEAKINNGNFYVGYSSWVDAPEQNELFYIYARCVRSLDGKWVKAHWELAGLKGIAHPKTPLFAEYVFLTDRTVLATGDLKFGRKEPFKYRANANFLKNELENNIGFAETAALAEQLEEIVIKEDLPEEILTISSRASVNFEIGERLFSLQFELISSLDGLSNYEGHPIQANVSFFPIEGNAARPVTIELIPQSEVLSKGLALSFDSGSINVVLEAEESEIQSFQILVPEFAEGPNIYQDTIDVVYNGSVLASFPVSFYADSRMNVSLFQ